MASLLERDMVTGSVIVVWGSMAKAMGWIGFRVQLYPPTEMYHILTLPQLAEPPNFAQGARSLPLRASHNTAFVDGTIHIHARAAEFDDMGFVSV